MQLNSTHQSGSREQEQHESSGLRLPSMTIVMPALNEEENIEAAISATLEAFDRLGIVGDIVVVDDGSTDRTGERVRNIMAVEPRVKMIRHEHAQGLGASFWDGVAHARGEILSWLPGDFENDPGEILRYHGLLSDVDFVVPFAFNRCVRSRIRNVTSYLFGCIINTTFRVNFHYTNGTVMYRRKVLDEIKCHSRGFLFTTEILVRLNKRGYLFAEVPYRLRSQPKKHSNALSFGTLSRVVCDYLQLLRDFYLTPQGNAQFVEGSATARRRGK